MDFGLIFFSSMGGGFDTDKYRLLIESARFGDASGLSSVWVPERHFTKDGWLYPNPAVVHAALSRLTTRIALRAGSVVLPLHDPIRVAEEWAVVDNLSSGRVGVSFASGWHPDDFVFFPERYDLRHDEMYRGIETVRQLWRGEAIERVGGDGRRVKIRTYPRPVQPELPIWITAAGDARTFEAAGRLGAGMLTHMFNQSVDDLARKIGIYRDSLERHGYDPRSARVTVLLHTFVSAGFDAVREEVENKFCDYIKSASYLLNAIAHDRGQQIDVARLSPQEIDEYARFVFARLVTEKRVLFETPENCAETIAALRSIGVSEIACQLDFGLETDLALRSLPGLVALKELANAAVRPSRANQSRPAASLEEIRTRCSQQVTGEEFYGRLRAHGVQLGSSFQGVRNLWRRDGESLGAIQIPAAIQGESSRYGIHPALLDACFQVLIAALPTTPAWQADAPLYLPAGLRAFRTLGELNGAIWSHASMVAGAASDDRDIEGNVRILDGNGTLLAEATGVILRRADLPRPESRDSDLSDLVYKLEWQRNDRTAVGAPREGGRTGTWWIVADQSGIASALAGLIQAQGHRCVVTPSVEEWDTSCGELEGVVHLSSLDCTPVEQTTLESLHKDQALGCGSVLRLAQLLAGRAWRRPPRMWLVTRGAIAVGGDSSLAPAQAPVWGFGRTSALELPELWGGLIDLDPASDSASAAGALWDEISLRSDREDQIAFRNGGRHVARFIRRSKPLPAASSHHLDPLGSYLVTGGFGGLGLEVARWLVDRGARHLVLLGRSALPPRSGWDSAPEGTPLAGRVAAIREIEAAGAKVFAGAVDVADRAAMAAVLAECRVAGWPPIRGVIHAAAVVQGATVPMLDAAAIDTVMRPKALGGWVLHCLFEQEPLDFFVLFSAIPAVLGWLGQGAANYSAANAFLDTLAHYRRGRGLPALSINWGPWNGIGLAARAGDALDRLAQQGVNSIAPPEGIRLLDRMLWLDEPQCAVVAVDWDRFFRVRPGAAASTLLAGLLPRGTPQPAGQSEEIRRALAAGDSAQRARLVASYVGEQVAGVLKISPSKLDPQQPLGNLGLDSLMAIELKNRVETALGVRVPILTFLQGPSIIQLTTQLLGLIDSEPAPFVDSRVRLEPAIAKMQDSGSDEREKDLLRSVDELTDDEVDSLLTAIEAEE